MKILHTILLIAGIVLLVWAIIWSVVVLKIFGGNGGNKEDKNPSPTYDEIMSAPSGPCFADGLTCKGAQCSALRQYPSDFAESDFNPILRMIGYSGGTGVEAEAYLEPFFEKVLIPLLSKVSFKYGDCTSASIDCIDMCGSMHKSISGGHIDGLCFQGMSCFLKTYTPNMKYPDLPPIYALQARPLPAVGRTQKYLVTLPLRFSGLLQIRAHTPVCGTQHTAVQVRLCSILMMIITVKSGILRDIDMLDFAPVKNDWHITDTCVRNITQMGDFFAGNVNQGITDSINDALASLTPALKDAMGSFTPPLQYPNIPSTVIVDKNGRKYFYLPLVGFANIGNPWKIAPKKTGVSTASFTSIVRSSSLLAKINGNIPGKLYGFPAIPSTMDYWLQTNLKNYSIDSGTIVWVNYDFDSVINGINLTIWAAPVRKSDDLDFVKNFYSSYDPPKARYTYNPYSGLLVPYDLMDRLFPNY